MHKMTATEPITAPAMPKAKVLLFWTERELNSQHESHAKDLVQQAAEIGSLEDQKEASHQNSLWQYVLASSLREQ